MATTAPPRPTTQVDAPAARLGVTQARVVRAEWIKLRSVHSTAIGFLAAAIVAVVLGLVFPRSPVTAAVPATATAPAGAATRCRAAWPG